MVTAVTRGRSDKADVVLFALAYTSRRNTRRDFDVVGSRGNCARKRSLTRTRFFVLCGGSSERAAAADSTFLTRHKFPARRYLFLRRSMRSVDVASHETILRLANGRREMLRARDIRAIRWRTTAALGHSATWGIYLRSSARRPHAVLRSRRNLRPRHARSPTLVTRVYQYRRSIVLPRIT